LNAILQQQRTEECNSQPMNCLGKAYQSHFYVTKCHGHIISINSGNGFQVGNGLIFELQNLMLIDYKLNGRETLSN